MRSHQYQTQKSMNACRGRNIMLFNLKESNRNELQERIADDVSKISEILSPANVSREQIVKVLRLGKKSNKNRPTKVVLDSQDIALKVLKNKTAVSGATNEKISIFEDRTVLQRTYLNNVRDQLQQRKEAGEHNIAIKYNNEIPTIFKTSQKN
ncbi:hypothetical protein HHI36_001859 [Cryptolaemus montrouzieri]|uniref:Uncharacterized protein n=1 Tax=Cryptolaemus montrouzieri TaxID=559131 RepID=A0ABD2P8T0_9CUCU